MKKHHTTIVLLTLFFTGLIVLWWAEYAGIPTSQELEANRNLVLPELARVAPVEIRRLEIDQQRSDGENGEGMTTTRIVLERRDDGWQMIEPVNAAADPSRADTLAQNLKNLVKSIDAGTILDGAKEFGLEPPLATIRAYGAKADKPLASLDVGTTSRDRLYVRPTGKPGIEVVDARLLKGAADPAANWRDQSIFNMATFQVTRFAVTGPGRNLKAERIAGSWKIQSPIVAPGDDNKVEDVLSDLTSLRVSGGTHGFVADDVKDLARYGLDKDHAVRVELVSLTNSGRPQSFLIGKAVAEQPGKVYAMPGGQDDVVAVDGKALQDLGTDPNALRSNQVLLFDPARVTFLRVEALGRTFDLARVADGWQIVDSGRERAETAVVTRLLTGLKQLQTSEFLSPSRFPNTGLARPSVLLKVWQLKRGERLPAKTDGPIGELVVDLRLGRQDVAKKTIYGQIGGDPMVLALPDSFLDLLPQNELAFRQRSLLDLNVGAVARLTIIRDGQTMVLAPSKTGDPNRWQMLEPVQAPADTDAITKALVLLSKLRAEQLISDRPGQESAYGLDAPSMMVRWTTVEPGAVAGTSAQKEVTLRIGSKQPKSGDWYASLSDRPLVFTLSDAVVLPLREEMHTRNVLTLPLNKVQRLTLRWPDRSMSFVHHPTSRGGVFDWSAAPATILVGFDLSRISALATELSRLKTRKFLQYKGPLPVASGLDRPQLTVEYTLEGDPQPKRLRVGSPFEQAGEFYATTAPGNDGNVFVLGGTGWEGLINSGGARPSTELPPDVFAPDRGKPER